MAPGRKCGTPNCAPPSSRDLAQARSASTSNCDSSGAPARGKQTSAVHLEGGLDREIGVGRGGYSGLHASAPEQEIGIVMVCLDSDPEKLRQRQARRRSACLMRKYSITPEQWDEIFEAQDRCCAICKSVTPRYVDGWHVDHDHKTGKVRGILCQPCNHLLGKAKDDISFLYKVIDYLEMGRKSP